MSVGERSSRADHRNGKTVATAARLGGCFEIFSWSLAASGTAVRKRENEKYKHLEKPEVEKHRPSGASEVPNEIL